jgi:hypothetical protein
VPYAAEISRTNPSCILFLIDQSGSMKDGWGGQPGRSKAEGLATAINRLLQNLVIKCAKSEGVRDYFEVGVIGYGSQVGPALGGALAGRNLVRISEIADQPMRIEERQKKVEDGAGGLVTQTVKFPVWFDPVANGGTPMCQALDTARTLLADSVTQHPASFPPIVINISDGEPTDGDPLPMADNLRQLSTADGNVLLFNIHISSHQASPIEFPADEAALPDDHARLLFRMSSLLPAHMLRAAVQEGLSISDDTRGFVFNATMESLIQFLDIGTRPSNLR